jgi:hypothetical protein
METKTIMNYRHAIAVQAEIIKEQRREIKRLKSQIKSLRDMVTTFEETAIWAIDRLSAYEPCKHVMKEMYGE